MSIFFNKKNGMEAQRQKTNFKTLTFYCIKGKQKLKVTILCLHNELKATNPKLDI